MDFDTVCVDITRGRHIAYLGIGSNLGDKEAYLDYAVDQLNKDDKLLTFVPWKNVFSGKVLILWIKIK